MMELTAEELEQYRLAWQEADRKYLEAAFVMREAQKIYDECKKEMIAKMDAYSWAKLGMVQPEVKA